MGGNTRVVTLTEGVQFVYLHGITALLGCCPKSLEVRGLILGFGVVGDCDDEGGEDGEVEEKELKDMHFLKAQKCFRILGYHGKSINENDGGNREMETEQIDVPGVICY